MRKPSALFICGSLNQTTMMYKVSRSIPGINSYFSPYFADGLIQFLANKKFLEHTILGGAHKAATLRYLKENKLPIDHSAKSRTYDLYVTCSDLIIPNCIKGKRLVLIQEGMTEPESIGYFLVKYLKFPRYLANTSATGLSDQYDVFCVASPGYRDHFIKKGVQSNKVIVTGIPNFDHCSTFLENDFLYRDYALIATSSLRETGTFDDRISFLKKAKALASDLQIIVKLHPNEKFERAIQEIRSVMPEAVIFTDGNTNHMIANCQKLITQTSTVVFTGLALDKEVYSYFDIGQLRRLMPIQNNGTSSQRIARICDHLINIPLKDLRNSRRRNYLQRKMQAISDY